MSETSSSNPLLQQLTLAEKGALVLGSDMWQTTPVPRLGIPTITISDGPHGLRRQPDGEEGAGVGGSLPATCFPTGSALGSSWNPALVRRVGEALGRVRGAPQERGRDSAVAPHRRGHHRGGRGVRPYAALPGRRQFASQPHPGRPGARRASSRRA